MQQSDPFLNLSSIIPPSPVTKRGDFSSLDINNFHFLYFNSHTLILRPIDHNKSIKYFIHKTPILSAKFSPDGKLIASIDQKGTLIIHQIGENQLIQYKVYENVYTNAKSMDWTADKKRICVVGAGKNNFGRVILVDSGTNAGEISGVSANLTCCHFRPERPYNLALAGDQYLVKFFQGPPYKFVKSSQKNHSNFINSIKFSLLGTYLLTVSSDKKIVLYNGTTFQKISQKSNAHTGSIYGADWVDQKRFVTVSADKTIKVWNVQNLEEISLIHSCDQEQTKNMKKVDNFQVAVKCYENKIYSLGLNGQIKVFQVPSSDSKVLQFSQKLILQRYAGCLQKPKKIIHLSNKKLIILDSNGKILSLKILSQFSFNTNLISIKNKIVQNSIADGFWNQKIERLIILWGDGSISQLKFASDFEQLEQTLFIQDSNAKFISINLQSKFDFITANNKINGYSGQKILTKSQQIQQDITTIESFRNILALGTIKGNILVFDSQKLQFLSKINISASRISCIKISVTENNQVFVLICGDSLGKFKILNYSQQKSLKQLPDCLGNHESLITSINSYNSTNNKQFLLTFAMDNKINLWSKIQNQHRYERISDWRNVHNLGILGTALINQNILLTFGGDYLIKAWKINI